jgi:hypothetical protein
LKTGQVDGMEKSGNTQKSSEENFVTLTYKETKKMSLYSSKSTEKSLNLSYKDNFCFRSRASKMRISTSKTDPQNN